MAALGFILHGKKGQLERSGDKEQECEGEGGSLHSSGSSLRSGFRRQGGTPVQEVTVPQVCPAA